MIEQNLLKWLEVGDSIQKMDIYSKTFRLNFFKFFHSISKNMNFSELFHDILVIIFFAQIWEINISELNIDNDKFLQIVKNIKNILIFQKIIEDKTTYIIMMIISIAVFLISIILLNIHLILLIHNKTIKSLVKVLSFLTLIYIYYLNGPMFQVFIYPLICPKGVHKYLNESCHINNILLTTNFIFCLIFFLVMFLGIIIFSLYINDINTINGPSIKSKINNKYTTLIVIIKIIYFILEFLLSQIFHEEKFLVYIFQVFLIIFNISLSIYSYKVLYYYNNNINILHHLGWYFTAWFSICIFFKNLLKIKDITLFLIFGFLLLSFSYAFNEKYKRFKLLTEFNILLPSNLIDIEVYSDLLLTLYKQKEAKKKTLLAGIIKKSEEILKTNPELNEIYNKFITSSLHFKVINSMIELKILSIIAVVYINNEEKSKDKIDVCLNRSYFLINKCKNITLATFIACKLSTNSHIQAYYKYVLLEEIKSYLLDNLKKSESKLSMKNVQFSTVILYNQLVDLFKIEIYDSTCSQIEYFDILKNNIATDKATENFLSIGENILSIRKNILHLWEKMIELNPFDLEAERDYNIYLDIILQDDFLKKEEKKKYNDKKNKYYHEKNNIYFDMYNQDKSAVLLCDGYSGNGKIFYYTPNFANLFGFTGKEISNISIDDLLPDVIQSFHKYLVEDVLNYSNLNELFKESRTVLLKGKNGLLFNINLHARIVPNLSYGLLYIIYIQKIQEKNFMIILDDKFCIDGYTEHGQISSNFTMNSGGNFGMSQLIIGYHIGLIIPEILLQLNYDVKRNSFFIIQENVDLKGFFHPINNYKEMSVKIQNLLENIKQKRLNEQNDEEKDKFIAFDEYNDFIKEMNTNNCKKSYSIFYRIQCRNFLEGKYKYYKVYITYDLLYDNLYDSVPNNDEKNINYKMISDKEIKNVDKIIKIKTFINKKDTDNLKKKKVNNEIKTSKNNNTSKEKESNLNKINFSQPTFDTSSILSKTNRESNEFHKLKNEIINKKDFFNVRLIKCINSIYVIIIIALIIYDYCSLSDVINSTIEFLKENVYFEHTKISCANAYNAAINIQFIKLGYINQEDCPNSNCTEFYTNLLIKTYTEIRNLKYDINSYLPDFSDIFKNKDIVESERFGTSQLDNYSLDMDNYLNFLIANGIKIVANISEYFADKKFFRVYNASLILDAYARNLLRVSYSFFNSNYSGFAGEGKTKLLNKYSSTKPTRIICSVCVYFVLFVIILYLIYRLYSTEIVFLDKLINFSSLNFDEYLKKLEELKKVLRDENNDDEDKMLDEVDGEEEVDEENNKKQIKNFNLKNSLVKKKDNLRKKKNKENKLHLQKLKKKKSMSDYFFKINILFAIEIGILSLILVFYFIISLLVFENYKKNYLEFDESYTQINDIYFNIFKTFLLFKNQIHSFSTTNRTSDIKIPSESEIIQPKLGNSLFNIFHSSIYDSNYLEKIKLLYNENACQILIEDQTKDKYCNTIFSSVVQKGLDQVIVQMSIIINNCIDELNILKRDGNLSYIYSVNNSYYNYEILVGHYLYESFLITIDIFNVFRENEKDNIFNLQKIIIIVYAIFIVIVSILLTYFVISYKNIGNSFFNFIGILPNKFILDDENFYESVLQLGEYLY